MPRKTDYDFGLTLQPGRWVLWGPSAKAWDVYLKGALRPLFGDSFRVVQVRGGSEGSESGIWVVLDVSSPVDVSEGVMPRIAEWYEGVTPESLGWLVQGEPSWIHEADQFVAEVKSAGREAARVVSVVGGGATKLVWAAAGLLGAWALWNWSKNG